MSGSSSARLALVLLAGCWTRAEPRPVTPTPTPTPVASAIALTAAGLDGAQITAPVTAASVRVPGYTASESVEYSENSPDTPVPTICLVRRGGACDVVLFADGGQLTRIRVLDPAILAAGVVGVGRPYLAIRAGLERCQVIDGVERGMNCAVRGTANIEVWFALGDDVSIKGTTPTPEILERATVSHLWWWLPGT